MLYPSKGPNDSTKIVRKIIVLNFGLLAVIYFIYALRSNGLGPVDTFLGLSQQPVPQQKSLTRPPTPSFRTAKVLVPGRVTWCNKSITGLEMPGKVSMAKVDHNWVRGQDAKKSLSTESVETWLSRHCSLKVKEIANPSGDFQFSPALIVSFANGRSKQLFRAGQVYRWDGRAFSSRQLDLALTDLERLLASSSQP